MINYRHIFNVNYGFIGIGIIFVLMLLLVMLDKSRGFRHIGDAFFIAGIVMLVIYIVGGFVIDGLYFKFFIEVISNSFFSFLIVGAIVSLVIGLISNLYYRYVK